MNSLITRAVWSSNVGKWLTARQEAAVGITGLQARGGVGEHQAALLGEPEQRPQRGDRVAELVTPQRVQHGFEVVGGDLAEMAADRRPALDERPDGSEVDVDAGGGPGPGPGAPVKSPPQPCPDPPAQANPPPSRAAPRPRP